MGVADMDFQTAPEILAAIEKRAKAGIFGYHTVPEDWYDAICCWWQGRHHFAMERDWLLFSSGVIPAISGAIRKLTAPGEKVLVQTPSENIFFRVIRDNGRQVLESPLKYDGTSYTVDLEGLKSKLADPQTTVMILCNPHSPTGNLWDKETLERIGELCWKNHVIVLSDEIHCDLTDPRYEYTPFASVSEHCAYNSITYIAPAKAFNLAGLQTSAAVVPNPALRQKVTQGLHAAEVAEPNSFAIEAAVAAFTRGGPWLDELRQYLAENKAYVLDFLTGEIPQIKAAPSKATYFLWLDSGRISWNSEELAAFIRKETGLWLCAGAAYGKPGHQFLGMNIACPRRRLEDGLDRLKRAVPAYEAWAAALC